MHAVSHSLAHRGPGASRARPRWQPYSAISSNPSRSPTNALYLNTPSSVSSSPPSTSYAQPISHFDNPKKSVQSPHPAHLAQLRDAQKNKYVARLVDQAVKSLCDIWHPDDIPPAFRTTSRTAFSASQTGQGVYTHQHTQNHTHSLNMRNLQLPSPISPSPQSHFSFPPPAQFPPSPNQQTDSTSHIVPIKGFVHEVLRRSRTSAGVLQTALCYLEAVRLKVPGVLRQYNEEGSSPSPDDVAEARIIIGSSDDIRFSEATFSSGHSTNNLDSVPTVRIDDDESLPTAPPTQPMFFSPVSMHLEPQSETPSPTPSDSSSAPLPSPLLCPRRTFLACLILASKFMQDRSYSNRAWAKLAGLPPREIGRCERALGNLLEWRLWVGKGVSPPGRSGTGNRSVTRSRSDGDVLYGCGPTAAMHTSARTAVPRQRSGLQRASTLPDLTSTSTASESLGSTYLSGPQLSSWFGEESGHAASLLVPSPVTISEAAPQPIPLLSAATLRQVFVSPSMSTPPLSYSPSSSSSDEGERTVLMSTVMDTPSFPPSTTLATPHYAPHAFGRENACGFALSGSANIVISPSKSLVVGSQQPFVYTPSAISFSPYTSQTLGPLSRWTVVPP